MVQRIQRKRSKGWRMPPNAIYVGRPTKFGNPYPVSILGVTDALLLFKDTAQGFWSPRNVEEMADVTAAWVYELHCAWRKKFTRHPMEVIHHELRGKDLACWCKLSEPCHADVLLEIANS